MSLDKNISIYFMKQLSGIKLIQWNNVLMKPFAFACLPSIATEERAHLIKTRHLYWTLIFAWMRRFRAEKRRQIGDWGCTVRVPGSHLPSPHYRSTGKRLMLHYLQRRLGSGGVKRAGESKLWGMYFCEFKIHILYVWKIISHLTGVNLAE